MFVDHLFIYITRNKNAEVDLDWIQEMILDSLRSFLQ